MSDVGDRSENWRGSYDSWLTHDRRNDDPEPRERYTAAPRSPTAAQDAFGRGPHVGLTAAEAYQIARRAVRTARDLRGDPVMVADWLALARHTRGLARDLRRRGR